MKEQRSSMTLSPPLAWLMQLRFASSANRIFGLRLELLARSQRSMENGKMMSSKVDRARNKILIP